jgi:ribonuclease HII
MVGVDEAGYGPNLGPLVMTAVACRVPDPLHGADLWQVLKAVVRRESDRADERLLIADSKVVHAGPHGLEALAVGVLTPLSPGLGEDLSFRDYLTWLCPNSGTDLDGEPWYTGLTPLPIFSGQPFVDECRMTDLDWGHARTVIVSPARFNQIVERWDTKGAVLGEALTELIGWVWNLPGHDAMALTADKHGGRNTYASMLQDAVPEGMIIVDREGMQRSSYRLLGGPRLMSFTFQPRADAEHFLVALASMVSKYVRELLMGEFNAYWQERVPGLKPTAGYPNDARRFFEAIRPKILELGLAEKDIWRCR